MCAEGLEIAQFRAENPIDLLPIPIKRADTFWGRLVCFYRIFQQLRYKNPQILHANTPVAAGMSLFASWLLRIPVRIYEVHGSMIQVSNRLWLIEKIVCGFATHIIAVSPSLRQLMIDSKLTKPDKIRVVCRGSCNGVDTTKKFNFDTLQTVDIESIKIKLKLKPTQKVAGFVGRLTTEKGLNELYGAWQIVNKKYQSAILLVVGGLDDRLPLPETLWEKLNDCPSIILTGHIEDVALYYALIDFLVLPSHREGFGNVVLEAAAMKKPTIGSNIVGLQDAIIDNKTGLLFEPKNINDLAENVEKYLENQLLVEQHGLAAYRRVVEDFAPKKIWEAKFEVYEDALYWYKTNQFL